MSIRNNLLEMNKSLKKLEESGVYDVEKYSYLRSIMKSSNLSLTCLPSDVCMMIYSNKIVVEEAFEQSIIYSRVK